MESLPLYLYTPHKLSAIINRLYTLLHFVALTSIIYYRLSFFLSTPSTPPLSLTHLLVFASELLLSFLWLLHQAFTWRPVSRTVFPERLQQDKELPALDVFICTADPKKEPPFDVMNTVLSAMALDYPPEKLHVYLSDDGGSSLTLVALREACVFARSWLPFCRRFEIKTRCPKVFFSSGDDDHGVTQSVEYEEEREKIKRKYELFKERVHRDEEKAVIKETSSPKAKNHPSIVEVVHDSSDDVVGSDQVQMPLLVYVSREKKPPHPHHFKAGALNVLLRVSSILSNSSYILILDCDMYCNDSTSARQAMCFHLDPKISPSLAFVQFPQKFHNISKTDIYDSQLRITFMTRWPGIDGIQGPMLSGTGYYMKREALYGKFLQKDLFGLKQAFGPSNELIMSLQHNKQHNIIDRGTSSSILQEEAQFLASCTYEKETLWGKQASNLRPTSASNLIGFLYNSMLEDYFTGFILHCKGWNSVFCNPSRPAFLGTATTKLNDTLVQGTRWNCGLLEVTFSKFCPLVYGLSRMSVLQTMCYAYYSLQPLYSLPLWCFATLPQLCLLNGIPLYPKASSPWFMILTSVFIFSQLKNVEEVLLTGGSVLAWWNEQRMWMIKSVTAYTYGTFDAILKCLGMRQPNFLPTNKVSDNDEVTLYQLGKFNFQTSTNLLVPIVTLVVLNMIAFAGGFARMIISGSWNELLGQVFLSFYILWVNYPIIEGVMLRKDKGRVPPSVGLLSLVLSIIFLSLGSMVLRFQAGIPGIYNRNTNS
ncbi:hypothetical protein Pint_24635 [Pistacia integerrima]|uniref:Uncharacterized protein n=1 Tax=Pistacia integerrima TaxID=434235 RepID=A0ACC0YB91_9ROSI|nr:hypothetical protein Pint_24635 [Pistacia integerrima]